MSTYKPSGRLTERLDEGFRSVLGNVADVDEGRHEVLVRIPHESYDSYDSDFARGAFAESFERNPHFPLLEEHRPELRLGHAISAQVLPMHNEIRGQFDRTPVADRGFRRILDGIIKGWSMWFRHGIAVPHPTRPEGRRYVKASFEELSAVRRPSIPGTVTAGLRSAEGAGYAHGWDFGYRSQPEDDYEDDLGELEYAIDEARYHIVDLRRDGKIPPSKCQQIASRFDHSREVLASVRNRGVLLSRRSVGLDDIEEAFGRAGRRSMEGAQALAVDGTLHPVQGVNKYAMTDPDRAGLFDALFDILTEIHFVASTLPLVPGGRLLLAVDQIHKNPSPAAAAEVVAALGALAPHIPSPAANARLLDLGVQVAIATDRMCPPQRLATLGVIGQN